MQIDQDEPTNTTIPRPSSPATIEQLESLVARNQFDSALSLSLRLQLEPSYTSYLAQRVYLSLAPQQLNLERLEKVFNLIVDDEWLSIATCHLLRSPPTSSTELPQSIIEYVLEKGLECSDVLILLKIELNQLLEDHEFDQITQLLRTDSTIRKGVMVRKVLLAIDDKRRTWKHVFGQLAQKAAPAIEHTRRASEQDDENADEGADEWGDIDIPTNDSPKLITTRLYPSLAKFISQPLIESVLSLASSSDLDSIKFIVAKHHQQLWPYRFIILNSIPEWQDPQSYADLLPALDHEGNEIRWSGEPWRTEPDWSETIPFPPDQDDNEDEQVENLRGETEPRTSQRLTEFYIDKIEHVASFGLISTALALVQHCATLNVPHLEQLGEELSLLSRLVYDRPIVASTSKSYIEDDDQDFTLIKWRAMQPAQIIESYLSTSTPTTIASSIRKLVLPYLSVLEARLERSGQSDPTLSSRLLSEFILSLASSSKFDSLVQIFENSKPTLPMHTRLIKSDEDLARLALACIYGSNSILPESLVSMGKIFECLPAFDSSNLKATTSDSESSTIDLYSIVTLDSSSITPSKLYASLQPFSTSQLSSSLDILDLHLSQAEIFSRYSCPVPLGWFLTTYNDYKSQFSWATRLARTASSGGGGKFGEEGEFESEDEWVGLMDDMVGLTQGKDQGVGLRKAFGLIETEAILRIFFGGLIAAGRISLAKSLLQPSSRSAPLEPKAIEELVIAASREFYDNAPSGNLNKGEMKMAFDCLSAAPQTPSIRKERDFIEATSRLCSFNIHSHPGIPVTPIEIRLSKDRLEFVARLLGSNEDAYRHPDVILELVDGLGYKGDRVAEVRTLAMIADSALQVGDWEKTTEVCDRMVAKVEEIRNHPRTASMTNDLEKDVEEKDGFGKKNKKKDEALEAAEFAWRGCFQLGKHDLFVDLDRRLVALGQALLLCPSDKIMILLPVWTELETRIASRPDQPLASRGSRGVAGAATATVGAALSSVKAKETFSRAAAFFSGAAGGGGTGQVAPSSHSNQDRNPPSRSGHYGEEHANRPPSSTSVAPPSPSRNLPPPPSSVAMKGQRSGSVSREGGGFRAGISGIAAAGVGWLIGADEDKERAMQQQERDW